MQHCLPALRCTPRRNPTVGISRAVTAEFVLTGLSNANGNAVNHELGVCLPAFTMSVTRDCTLTLTPKGMGNAAISLLKIGAAAGQSAPLPRATSGASSIRSAVEQQAGYYYLQPKPCPTSYRGTIKGAALNAGGEAGAAWLARLAGAPPSLHGPGAASLLCSRSRPCAERGRRQRRALPRPLLPPPLPHPPHPPAGAAPAAAATQTSLRWSAPRSRCRSRCCPPPPSRQTACSCRG